MAFKAQIKGLDKLQAKLKDLPKEIEVQVNEELEDFCRRVVGKAITRAPKNIASLSNSIRYEPLNKGFAIIAGVNYAAYVEFGTRSYVKIPEGLSLYAAQFKGTGTGDFKTFLKNIQAWCKKKGIEEKAAYPIAVSILRNGIKPQPFFFNSYFEELKVLEQNLNNIEL